MVVPSPAMSAVSSASSIAGRVLHLAAVFVDALQDVVLQADLQLTKQQTVRSATDSLWALQDSEAGAELTRMVFSGNGIPGVSTLP